MRSSRNFSLPLSSVSPSSKFLHHFKQLFRWRTLQNAQSVPNNHTSWVLLTVRVIKLVQRAGKQVCRRATADLWHHVTMMMRPPGMHTLANSPTKRALSGMCSPLSMLHTRSKELSSKGCCNASAT